MSNQPKNGRCERRPDIDNPLHESKRRSRRDTAAGQRADLDQRLRKIEAMLRAYLEDG